MGIRESALNTIASLANGDFVRMVTAAGASRKASLQTIAQHIIENYTGSSLAGSNQSVKSALDALNSTTGTFTFASGITGTNNLDIRQSGNVVTINGYIGGLSITSGSQTEIGTISGVKLPPTQLRFRGACGPNSYSSGSNAYFALNSQGKLYVNSAGNGSNVYFSCSYVAA